VIQLAASCDVDDIEVRPVLKGWCDPMAPIRLQALRIDLGRRSAIGREQLEWSG